LTQLRQDFAPILAAISSIIFAFTTFSLGNKKKRFLKTTWAVANGAGTSLLGDGGSLGFILGTAVAWAIATVDTP